jgi:CheY-like chemotaxis protein
VREATCQILQGFGFDVLPVADATEAMTAYQRHGRRIDLLMTDVGLPGRNGLQLAQDLRSIAGEIPILLTSGYLEPGFDREARQSKTYFLPKPYARAELLAAMDTILRSVLPRRSATQAS